MLWFQTFKESGDAYAHIDAKHTRRGENDWDEVEDVMNDVEMEIAEEQQLANNRAAAVGIPNGILLGAGPAAPPAAPAAAVGDVGVQINLPRREDMDPERLQVRDRITISQCFFNLNLLRWL